MIAFAELRMALMTGTDGDADRAEEQARGRIGARISEILAAILRDLPLPSLQSMSEEEWNRDKSS